MEKLCEKCSKPIPYWRKFCSSKCYWDSKIGKKHNWGIKISKSLRGKKKSPDHIKKVADALRGQERLSWRGSNHFAWKGRWVNYGSLHDWVARYRGREKKCSRCGLSDAKRKYNWANISGKYKRDLNDWIRLCIPCHRNLDNGRNSMNKIWKKVKEEYIRIKVGI